MEGGSQQLFGSNSYLIQQSTIRRLQFFRLILFWIVAAMNESNDGIVKKIERAAQIIVDRGIVLEGVSIRDDLEEIGVFSRAELDTTLIRKIQGKIQRKQTGQEHMTKITIHKSAGTIKSPTQGMEYATAKMAVTETKGTFPGRNYEKNFDDNGLVVKERDIKAEIKNQEELKRKVAPETEKSIPPKRHQCPVELAILPPQHQCLQEIASLVTSNLAEVGAPVHMAGAVAPVDMTRVVAHMDTAGVVITKVSSTPLYPFSNPSLPPTRQHFCTTPDTGLGVRRLAPLFEDSQEEVTHQGQDSPVQEQRKENSKFDNELKGVITDWLQKELLPAINLDASGQKGVGHFDVRNVSDMILNFAYNLRNRNDSRTTKIISGKTGEEAIQTPCPVGPQQLDDSKKYPSFAHYGIPLDDSRARDGLLQDLYKLNEEIPGSTTMYVDT